MRRILSEFLHVASDITFLWSRQILEVDNVLNWYVPESEIDPSGLKVFNVQVKKSF